MGRFTASFLSFVICLAIECVCASKLILKLAPNINLPNPADLAASDVIARLGSAGPDQIAHLRQDNSLEFVLSHDLLHSSSSSSSSSPPPDLIHNNSKSYLLSIEALDYMFEFFRVDVSYNNTNNGHQPNIQVYQTFIGNGWDERGLLRAQSGGDGHETADVVLEIMPVQVKEYYVKRARFSILSSFQNPMILIAIVSLGMIVGLPWLMDNMDPEMRSELEQIQQSKQEQQQLEEKQPNNPPNPAAQFQNFDMAGWLAGKPSNADTSGGTPTSSVVGAGGSVGKSKAKNAKLRETHKS